VNNKLVTAVLCFGNNICNQAVRIRVNTLAMLQKNKKKNPNKNVQCQLLNMLRIKQRSNKREKQETGEN
jgi:hypothetical protein